MIELVKWSHLFENSDTRKRQRLGWFLSPSGCDSRGFRTLMRNGAAGLASLGFFQALCQSMATMSMEIRKGGVFRNSDGSLMDLPDILELSRLGGMEPADARQILGRLSEIGWIVIHNPLEIQQSASDLPPICHPSATCLPGLLKEKEKEKEKYPPNPPEGGKAGTGDELPFEEPTPDVPQKPSNVLPDGWKKLSKTERNQKRVQANSKRMVRIGRWFNRREGNLWTIAEALALQEVNPSPAEIETMEIFYLSEIDSDKDIRRKALVTLLNNWNTDLDRARVFMAENGIQDPEQAA